MWSFGVFVFFVLFLVVGVLGPPLINTKQLLGVRKATHLSKDYLDKAEGHVKLV